MTEINLEVGQKRAFNGMTVTVKSFVRREGTLYKVSYTYEVEGGVRHGTITSPNTLSAFLEAPIISEQPAPTADDDVPALRYPAPGQ